MVTPFGESGTSHRMYSGVHSGSAEWDSRPQARTCYAHLRIALKYCTAPEQLGPHRGFIEALHPRAVVAGHGVLDPDSSPRHIEETRSYLRDFNAAVASTSTAQDLYEKMLTLHPNRVNPGSL